MENRPDSGGAGLRPWRLLGHPLHPATTHFPLALLVVPVLLDTAALLTGDPFWDRMAFWTLAGGLTAAGPALLTGLLEFAALGEEHPALRRATQHMVLMISAATFAGASLLFRGAVVLGGDLDSLTARITAALAAGLVLIGGWAGGDLVYRHRLGVGPAAPRDSS